ncbi:hypothetical protein [Streptomyces antibioticus]|uniref:hypothetical protein n=1 Tax=Streptomyces antibioticus TaxID=1890 RepID=UPI0036F72704
MSGAATTAQWLTSAAIGTAAGLPLLLLLKVALDRDADRPQRTHPGPRTPTPATPHPAAVSRARHAAPHRPDETQPITCVQPQRARHSKGHAVWT